MWCVCMWHVVCILWCVCVYTPVCQGQRVRSAVFLSLPNFWREGLPEPSWPVVLLSASSTLDHRHTPWHPAFMWVLGTETQVHSKHFIDLAFSSVLSRDFLFETCFRLLKIGFFNTIYVLIMTSSLYFSHFSPSVFLSRSTSFLFLIRKQTSF